MKKIITLSLLALILALAWCCFVDRIPAREVDPFEPNVYEVLR